MDNIALIGFQGVGKTTIGKSLARSPAYNIEKPSDFVREMYSLVKADPTMTLIRSYNNDTNTGLGRRMLAKFGHLPHALVDTDDLVKTVIGVDSIEQFATDVNKKYQFRDVESAAIQLVADLSKNRHMVTSLGGGAFCPYDGDVIDESDVRCYHKAARDNLANADFDIFYLTPDKSSVDNSIRLLRSRIARDKGVNLDRIAIPEESLKRRHPTYLNGSDHVVEVFRFREGQPYPRSIDDICDSIKSRLTSRRIDVL